MAQPSDLQYPVPGQQQPSLSQVMGPPGGEPSLAQFLSPQRAPAGAAPAGPTPNPQPNQGPSQPAAQSPQDLLAQFDQATGGQDPANDQQALQAFDQAFDHAKSNQPDTFDPTGEGAGLLARLKGGLGRTPEEQASLVASVYGKNNVRVKDGKVFWRNEGEKAFQNVEASKIHGLLDLFSNLAQLSPPGMMISKLMGGNPNPIKASKNIANAAVENSGLAVEAGVAVPADMIGSAMGGPAGFVAGAAAGGAAGAAARQGLISAAGGEVDPSVNLNREMLNSATANVVGGAVMGGLMKGATAGARMLGEAYAQRPFGRIQAIAKIQAAIENFANDFKVDGKSLPSSEVGMRVETAAQKERSILNGQIETMKNQIIQANPDAKFPMNNALRTLRQSLADQGATFDKNGVAMIDGKHPDINLSYEVPTTRQSAILDSSGRPAEVATTESRTLTLPGRPVAEPVAPFGAVGGEGVLNNLVKHYNDLLTATKQGGLKPDELFRTTQLFQDLGDYAGVGPNASPALANKLNYAFRNIGDAAAMDRDLMAGLALRGQPEEPMFKAAYEQYRTRIDPLKSVEKILNQKESPEMIADALIRPNNSERIIKFKKLFGDETNYDSEIGPVWQMVKGQWVDSLIEKNTSPSTGVMNAAGILQGMQAIGKETLDQVLTKAEQGDLRKLALKAAKIKTSDLVRPEEVTHDIMTLPFISKMLPSTQAGILWRVFKQDAKAADYLLEKGFMRQYRQAAPALKKDILATMSEFQKRQSKALLRKGKDGKFLYMDMPKTVRAGENTVSQSVQNSMSAPRSSDPTLQSIPGMEFSGSNAPDMGDAESEIQRAGQ